MDVTKKVYGYLEGQEVREYTLTNSQGVSLSALSYGAIVTQIITPDKDGKQANITLNVDSLSDMVDHRPFYGAVIGRVAGRIAEGQYSIDGQTYSLPQNEGKSTLHGGFEGLDRKIWAVQTMQDEEAASLIFEYTSPEGESGFTGTVKIQVTYTLTEANEWIIDYRATTDKPTLFNPTNHVYFNLTGDVRTSILDHELQLNSPYFVPLNDQNIPLGEWVKSQGTPFDFSQSKPLKEAVGSDDEQIKARSGLDHPFVLDSADHGQQGKLFDPVSGRTVTFTTDRNSVVIFTHNAEVDDFTLFNEPVRQYAGIALETQTLPDAVNQEGFGDTVIRPGQDFTSRTLYSFSCE